MVLELFPASYACVSVKTSSLKVHSRKAHKYFLIKLYILRGIFNENR